MSGPNPAQRRMDAEGRGMPVTNALAVAAAIAEFERALPGWWWSVGACSVSRDASCGPYAVCGPDRAGPDADLLADRLFDDGFHHDDREGTVAGSLRLVMQAALEARAKARNTPPAAANGGVADG